MSNNNDKILLGAAGCAVISAWVATAVVFPQVALCILGAAALGASLIGFLRTL
jgi:hypothetical protein